MMKERIDLIVKNVEFVRGGLSVINKRQEEINKIGRK